MAKVLKIDRLPKLPKRSFIYLLICGGGIFLFCLIGIYPNFKEISSLDDEISILNQQISEQEILFPVFKKMLSRIKQSTHWKGMQDTRKKLKTEDIAAFSDILGGFAQKSNLSINENTIDIRRFKEKGGFLEMNFSMNGDLDDFRIFIIQMMALPYDIRIGRLKIEPISEQKDFQFCLWLALE
ncbi:MAG: hypothetical protein C0403_13345 [Desulfobacterium sp.]|nr:hypothetical protein [Desulfobacterium sp.]